MTEKREFPSPLLFDREIRSRDSISFSSIPVVLYLAFSVLVGIGPTSVEAGVERERGIEKREITGPKWCKRYSAGVRQYRSDVREFAPAALISYYNHTILYIYIYICIYIYKEKEREGERERERFSRPAGLQVCTENGRGA